MNVKKAIKHFKLITKHKILVFKFCRKIGLTWRGIAHDLSKYSITEFSESIKYYVGNNSPITESKKVNGYSKAWLHHKGRNKHHVEYWYDMSASNSTPIIPYKYAAEMICDMLAAGIVYQGDSWTKEYELEYWKKEKDRKVVNDKIKLFITEILEKVAEKGIDSTLDKKIIKKIYKKYCE